METSNYRCAQPELYSAARMAIRAAIREIANFTPVKAKYNPAFFAALQAEVAAAEALPDEQSRTGLAESLRITTKERATACLNQWQFLKGYIEDAPTMQGAQKKPALEAAGSIYYNDAARDDWESVNQLMVSAIQFVTDYSVELADGNNMPPTFVTDLTTAHTDFTLVWQNFQDEEEQNAIRAQEKVAANNTLYDKVIQVCKDGQRIFRGDEARRNQFVWHHLLYLVRGAGIAGIRGTVLELSTQQPVAAATILIVETGDTGVPDEDGVYRITGVPAGNYTVRCTATGYNTIEQPFEVLTGTLSTLDFRLTAV
jgi:hypothetical protein